MIEFITTERYGDHGQALVIGFPDGPGPIDQQPEQELQNAIELCNGPVLLDLAGLSYLDATMLTC